MRRLTYAMTEDDLRRVKVVGEYRVPDALEVDYDHFLCVMAVDPEGWWEWPAFFSTVTSKQLMHALQIDVKFQLGPVESGTASRVIFPPELADRPMFELRTRRRDPGIWNRLLDAMSPDERRYPTQDIVDYLERGRPDRKGLK